MNKTKVGNTLTYTDKLGDILQIKLGIDNSLHCKFIENAKTKTIEYFTISKKEFIDAFQFECDRAWVTFVRTKRYGEYTTKVAIYVPDKTYRYLMVFTQEEADDLYHTVLDFYEKPKKKDKPLMGGAKLDLTTTTTVTCGNFTAEIKVTPNYDLRENPNVSLNEMITGSLQKKKQVMNILDKPIK